MLHLMLNFNLTLASQKGPPIDTFAELSSKEINHSPTQQVASLARKVLSTFQSGKIDLPLLCKGLSLFVQGQWAFKQTLLLTQSSFKAACGCLLAVSKPVIFVLQLFSLLRAQDPLSILSGHTLSLTLLMSHIYLLRPSKLAYSKDLRGIEVASLKDRIDGPILTAK